MSFPWLFEFEIKTQNKLFFSKDLSHKNNKGNIRCIFSLVSFKNSQRVVKIDKYCEMWKR